MLAKEREMVPQLLVFAVIARLQKRKVWFEFSRRESILQDSESQQTPQKHPRNLFHDTREGSMNWTLNMARMAMVCDTLHKKARQGAPAGQLEYRPGGTRTPDPAIMSRLL